MSLNTERALVNVTVTKDFFNLADKKYIFTDDLNIMLIRHEHGMNCENIHKNLMRYFTLFYNGKNATLMPQPIVLLGKGGGQCQR